MSVKRVVIRLSSDEYAALEAEATRERRTVAQQAAYRVTQQTTWAVSDKTITVDPYWPRQIAKIGGSQTARPGGTLVQ